MYCSNCGSEVAGKFCQGCGAPAAQQGQGNPQGNPQVQLPPNYQPTIIINNSNTNTATANAGYGPMVQKKKGTALLLCAIGFLGLGGLHRFYTGKSFSGIVYLLTAGLFWVGTTVDFLLILIGSFRDKSGAPLE